MVRSGSQLAKQVAPSMPQFASMLRKDYLDKGVVVDDGKHYVFTQDQVFSSPSTAASVVMGNSANGRIEWKTEDGKTLKELQSMAADKSGVTDME